MTTETTADIISAPVVRWSKLDTDTIHEVRYAAACACDDVLVRKADRALRRRSPGYYAPRDPQQR